MSLTDLEQALRSFDRIAKLESEDELRQVWHFAYAGRSYWLHFYPRRTGWVRLTRVNLALREFVRLQTLQRESIPSPRAVAQLAGFRIGQQLGDAVIIESIEGAIPLHRYLQDLDLRARPVPQRRELARQIVRTVERIASLKLGHEHLELSSFLIANGTVYFNDVLGLRDSGMRVNDLLALGHDASRFASRTELLRGWHKLNPDQDPPRVNPIARKFSREFVRRCNRENDEFGILDIGGWRGRFAKGTRFAEPWSVASRLRVTRADWESAWPALLAEIESGRFTTIKSDRSGEVLRGEFVLAGRPLSIYVKRPRRKFWFRYILDLFRPARALRTWFKAWSLIALHLPCEWPILVMRRKRLGYTIDNIIVFEHVPGPSLDKLDLDLLTPAQRDALFRRAGGILRRIEHAGLAHYDAKSTNWIVYEHALRGPIPVMIDVDGIRILNRELQAWGIRRLLRAMRLHPQYTPADSLALCQGYAPRAAVRETESETSDT